MGEGLEKFEIAARQYCEWAESESGRGEEEMISAMKHLLKLMELAYDIGLPGDKDITDGDDPKVNAAQYRKIVSRFSNLPFKNYSEIFDNTVVPPEEPVVGDISDDLADVYRDLKEGLMSWDAGNRGDAQFAWALGFRSHWGEHATSAIRAIHMFEREIDL